MNSIILIIIIQNRVYGEKMKQIFKIGLGVLSIAAALLVKPSSANANVIVCNKSNQNANVARAWLNDNWQAEGWFYVRPGECKKIITNKARFRTAHLYIMNDDGSPWNLGKSPSSKAICVKTKRFAHTNASGNCINDMYPVNFQKIPIRNRFTVNLQ